jgi:hypothetical protein
MIYIQINDEKKIAHHFDCSCAMYGAIEEALDYRLIHYDEIISGRLDNLIKNNLFVGSTEFMKAIFERIGKTNVRLPLNSNRKCKIIALSEALKIAKTKNIFIKPIEIKLFTGFVLDKYSYSCLNNLSPDTEVMMYEPFNEEITSEWRIYIHNHKMVDSRNYSGDFTLPPYYPYISDVIEQNKNTFPIAYTIDIAVLRSHKNEVVEFNDMWAIGNYGIPNDLYLRLLKDRYFEIVRS